MSRLITPESFQSALAKGTGLPALLLKRDGVAPYRETLLAACVENFQYERLTEENRGPYLMGLLTLAGLERAGRERIEAALPGAEAGWDRDLMLDLLEEMARAGDAHARTLLFDCASAGEERAQNNFSSVDDDALQWVESNVLPTLALKDRLRISRWLPEDEEDDRTETQRRLRATYQEEQARWKTKGRTYPNGKPDTREFLRETRAGRRPKTSAYSFARMAGWKEFREAAELLLKARDAKVAWNLSRAFRRQAFPIPLRRIFPHATHPERGGAVCRILGGIDAPQVRHFARKLLRIRPLPWNAVQTLTRSFRSGDEALVLSVLPDAAGYDEEDRHNVVLDVVSLIREHPETPWQPHAEWVYEHSPCSRCRASAVDWMNEHGTLPQRVLLEGPYDAEPEIREAVAGSTAPV